MLGLMLLLVCPQRVFAQDEQGQGDEVQLNVANFGIGGLAREGEWAGVQVQMQDLGSSSRDIVLRLEIPDEDGDLTQYDRVVTANPGVVQSFWLYCWLPFRSAGSEYTLKAFEAIDQGGSDNPAEIGFRAGRMLGSYQVYNPQIQPANVGLLGVLGTYQLGLEQYGYTISANPWMLFAHELQRTSSGLTIDNLPDRWQGLRSLDTIVWSTATTASHDPGRLTPEKARALREWVQRGGHLVVVLQSSGDPWYLGSHPLRPLLPAVETPKRLEGVDLERYRTLITEDAETPLPSNAVVYSFTPAEDAAQHEAMPILKSQDGETVVVRRLLGSGMVTVVGLPLNHGQLRRVGAPDAEAFWHRVLGLRGDVKRLDQMSKQETSDVQRHSPLSFDEGISRAISKTGTAVQGVFFGVVVFVLYWVIAGPLGYAILKQRKLTQHAWIGFVACIAGFTTIAWLGATAMRPKRANISHLTFIEQVAGQDIQRTRSFFSAMLPSYGQATVSTIDPEQGTGFGVQDSTDLLIPWGSPDTGSVLGGGFPDNSGYRVQSRSPAALSVPTRATVKSFMSDWAGDSGWGMPYVVGELGDIGQARLSVEGLVVSGKVAHNLPAPMKDVRVFVISREAPINRVGQEFGRRMIAQATVYAPDFGTNGWEPGNAIELRDITSLDSSGRRQLQQNYFETAVRYGVDNSGLTTNRGSLTDRLVAGRFITQFEPPRFGAATSDPVGDRLATRRVMHGWDLGRWFTQPTVIITGVVQIEKDEASEDAMPTPVWVNGRRVPATGTTVVTWVYPLDPAPPAYPVFDRSGEENINIDSN
ncbi:MAG: hypothetical protein CMJ35_02575 [Phycisphaerae bacterium]|nr:hypothetical protein [Phycisphaerae bacterium]